METKYSFTLMNPGEFDVYLSKMKLSRTIIYVQQHHTWSPNYAHFKGDNHFELQRSMKTHHITRNGWSDIGHHLTIFPDGMIMTGRSLENTPACIYRNNDKAICIENLGNFDKNGDSMKKDQRDAIVEVTAMLCNKFSVPIDTDKIVYHHWYHLSSGDRNNGARGNKSCPGTAFFGGNKVSNAKKNFIPLVRKKANYKYETASIPLLKYVCVTASKLIVRKGASTKRAKVKDRASAIHGAVLRVYGIKDGWYRISSSKQHWIAGRYTLDVERAIVTASKLFVRDQPTREGLKLGYRVRNEEVFVFEKDGRWSRIGLSDEWVYGRYLKFM